MLELGDLQVGHQDLMEDHLAHLVVEVHTCSGPDIQDILQDLGSCAVEVLMACSNLQCLAGNRHNFHSLAVVDNHQALGENHLDLVGNHLGSRVVGTLAVGLDRERLLEADHNLDIHWVDNHQDLVGSWDAQGDQVGHPANVMEDCVVMEIRQGEDVERGLHCVVAVVRELGKACGVDPDLQQMMLADLEISWLVDITMKLFY